VLTGLTSGRIPRVARACRGTLMACLLCILPQPGDPVRYLVLYAGTPLGNPRPGVPRRRSELLLLKEELFQLLRALHLPDAHIIGALTGDHLIPDVPLTSAQIARYGLKRCPSLRPLSS
jgi:hypothetical protein